MPIFNRLQGSFICLNDGNLGKGYSQLTAMPLDRYKHLMFTFIF